MTRRYDVNDMFPHALKYQQQQVETRKMTLPITADESSSSLSATAFPRPS